jgi:dTDP-4-dehydrorhamnose 3,5-epimerase
LKITPTALAEVLVVEPRVFADDRGFFLETFSAQRYADAGIPTTFAQDNLSRSVRGTLRGLHFQQPNAQGKLVQVVRGTVFDVVVDIRRGSPTFGRWVGVELDGDVPKQMWVPAGFAHGFCVTSETADFWYKCTTPYSPADERCVRWDEPELGIEWPVTRPLLSKKDASAPALAELLPLLPTYDAG